MQLTSEEERRLRELLEVFLAENAKCNLSAYRTAEQCFTGNILDAIAGLPLIADAKSVIEVGMGGGFPLLPLAILRPDVQFTGIDATQKKVAAVARIAAALQLENVTVICGRAEECGCDAQFREKYTHVIARAVAPLSVLLEYMSPFAEVSGTLLCWKSMHIKEELQNSIEARMTLKCRLTKKHKYMLPDDWGERQILVFEKTEPLSKQFPRAVGIPKKEPL